MRSKFKTIFISLPLAHIPLDIKMVLTCSQISELQIFFIYLALINSFKVVQRTQSIIISTSPFFFFFVASLNFVKQATINKKVINYEASGQTLVHRIMPLKFCNRDMSKSSPIVLF